jgi:hypothetical protein
MIQPKRMDQVPGQARDGEVDGHLQSPPRSAAHINANNACRPSKVSSVIRDRAAGLAIADLKRVALKRIQATRFRSFV